MSALHRRIYALFEAAGYDTTKPPPPNHHVPPKAKRLCLRAGEYYATAIRLMSQAEQIAIDAGVPKKYWATPMGGQAALSVMAPAGLA